VSSKNRKNIYTASVLYCAEVKTLSDGEAFIKLIEQNSYSKKTIKILDTKMKKIITLLIVLGTVTSIIAVQMAFVKQEVTHKVSTYSPCIRFMARDQSLNISDTWSLIRSNDNKTWIIKLGNWTVGTNRSYVAVFAVVNEEPFEINLTKIEVVGITRPAGEGEYWISDFLKIWLHSHPRYWCNPDLAGDDITETNENKTLMWNGTASTGGYWVLGAGDSDASTYFNGTNTYSSTWNSTYHTWLWDGSERGAYAGNRTADYVWVQMDLMVPDNALNGTYAGEIGFFFEAEAEV